MRETSDNAAMPCSDRGSIYRSRGHRLEEKLSQIGHLYVYQLLVKANQKVALLVVFHYDWVLVSLCIPGISTKRPMSAGSDRHSPIYCHQTYPAYSDGKHMFPSLDTPHHLLLEMKRRTLIN